MPRYAKFLFGCLTFGFLLLLMTIFVLLIMLLKRDTVPSPVASEITPVVTTEAPLRSTLSPPRSGSISTPTTPVAGAISTSVATSAPLESRLTVAEIGATFVKLSWLNMSDQVEELMIYYSIDDFYYQNHGAVPAHTTEYTVEGLACDTAYYFQLHPRTVHQTWLEPSNTVTIKTGACSETATPSNTPPAPTNTPPAPIETPTTSSPVLTCATLQEVGTASQILIVESESRCVPYFMNLLEKEPQKYLEAFYRLISSSATTDPLFTAVYDELLADRFQFGSEVVDDLLLNLPAAVGACVDHPRCAEWSTFILPALYRGDLYDCPDVSTLNETQLLNTLPYGNYACIEATAKALAPLASEKTITTLLEILSTHERDWSRRNAVRTLARLAQQPASQPANILIRQTYSTTIQNALMTSLEKESAEVVLHDAIWMLDTVFFPFLPMQSDLQAITAKKEFEPSLRFRALSSISRLIQAKTGLISQSDLDFLIGLLQSDNLWMRGQSAFVLETIPNRKLNPMRRELMIKGLDSAWADEEEVIAKAYMARALDRLQDSYLHDRLREEYEMKYLANSMSGERIIIRSGLPENELPAFISLMVNERRAFFDFMGLSFDTPVPGDLNDMITLILFANREEYSEYMNAFIGYGANAGGVYLEKEGILYTYQRELGQSRYTVEELVKHEFAHYLQGRYIFPGLWTDSTYHQEIKGWADEGLAEFFAGFTFDENGNYTYSAREVHLDTLCGVPHRDLTSLLNQSEGYNKTGTFDYANGWSFIFYMMTNRSYSALNLFNSFRDDTYKLENFANITGVPISNLEQEWHSSLDWWCTVSNKDGTSQADFTHGYSAEGGSPFGDANENIILHLPNADAPPELFGLPPE